MLCATREIHSSKGVWGDGSVDKALATRTQGLELRSPGPTQSWIVAQGLIPELLWQGEWRQGT